MGRRNPRPAASSGDQEPAVSSTCSYFVWAVDGAAVAGWAAGAPGCARQLAHEEIGLAPGRIQTIIGLLAVQDDIRIETVLGDQGSQHRDRLRIAIQTADAIEPP